MKTEPESEFSVPSSSSSSSVPATSTSPSNTTASAEAVPPTTTGRDSAEEVRELQATLRSFYCPVCDGLQLPTVLPDNRVLTAMRHEETDTPVFCVNPLHWH